MRVGKYESSEASTAGTAITFLLIGLGAGAVIGLLFAPKAGKQMRKDLRRKYDDARETLDDWKDEAKEVAEDALERGQEKSQVPRVGVELAKQTQIAKPIDAIFYYL